METICRLLQPWLLGILISLLMVPERSSRGLEYACAVLMGLIALIGSSTHVASFKCELMGMRLSSALRGLVYLKVSIEDRAIAITMTFKNMRFLEANQLRSSSFSKLLSDGFLMA